MPVETALAAIELYLKVGVLVAFVFVALVGYLDRAARGAYAFRPLLLPAAVLLWPLVLVRLVRVLRTGGVR